MLYDRDVNHVKLYNLQNNKKLWIKKLFKDILIVSY